MHQNQNGYPGQYGSTIIVQQPKPNTMPISGAAQGFGIMQIIIGSLCIVLQIAALSFGVTLAPVATGIWCGAFVSS